ncbi:MAG: DUF2723 domain-containing protein [Gemmatimonadota bacterium]|jgi:hypothetical protein|nr:DUF2723 domain-containing protein [Gemmatimonadota bacterium]
MTRKPYGTAVLAAACVFALYAITLSPTTAFWDASEYIATAHILGIPHPPGNPLFVLMARAWELLLAPTGLSVAVRVNLFSSLMTAGASFFWFLVLHRILSYITDHELVRKVGAGAGVFVAATAFTVWYQSNVNEKVYTVTLLTIAALTWLAFLWRDRVETRQETAQDSKWHGDNILVLILFLLALSVGNHLMAFLAAPAIGVLLLMVKPRVLLNWRLYGFGLVFVIIGLSVHLYLPIRAGLSPVINEADPTCESLGEALVSVVTMGSSGCAELSSALAREQYAKPPVSERLAPISAQVMNYLQYFDWQWSRSLDGRAGYFAPARLPFTLLFLGLGIFGAWTHRRRDLKSFAYIATLFVTLSLGLVLYLNFKYGFGQSAALGLGPEAGEVRERDYFFIVSFSIWGLWVGVGLTALWLRMAQRISRGRGEDSDQGSVQAGRKSVSASAPAPGSRSFVLASPVMVLAFIPLLLNWSYASRAGDYSARDWAFNLLNSVEPYGVLVTNGDNDTFPLWYLQEVEGVRRDVTVMVWSYLNTPWYVKQLRDLTRPCDQLGEPDADPSRILCQRPFDPATALPIYSVDRPPTRSVLDLSDEDINAVTGLGYARLPQEATFEARGLQVALPAGTVLNAADQLILVIIQRAWGDRPVYFAMTTQAHRNIGLGGFVGRQGLAYRLLTPEEMSSGQFVQIPSDHPWAPVIGPFVDVERTHELLWNQFVFRDLPGRSHWVDDATRGIPSYYAYTFLALAAANELQGNEPGAEQNIARFEEWSGLAGR